MNSPTTIFARMLRAAVTTATATALLALPSLLPTAARADAAIPAVAAPHAASCRLADDTGGIAWHTQATDIAAAMRQAAADHTPVLIVFHGWCPWCQRMDADTFSDSSVQALMSRFVCIQVDVDTTFGQALENTLGISGVPTTVLYAADGSRQPFMVGFKDAADFTAALNNALSA